MQWNPDRNAGFSTVADPGKLYLPVVQSLTNHFGGVNVEAQLATSSSLLHWVRGMLALRKRHPVFGLGTFVALPLVERGTVVTDTPACDNDAVLSFLRVLDRTVPGGEHEEPETVLCVHNLGSTPQAVTLSVPGHAGAKVVDLFGGQGFPPVGADGRLTLTMGSRDFFWLRLVDPAPAA
jgi:maltose alpha-D-glucosyltransferase/alpha-amylase